MPKQRPEAATSNPEVAQEDDLPAVREVMGVDGSKKITGWPYLHRLERKDRSQNEHGVCYPGWFKTKNGNIREDY